MTDFTGSVEQNPPGQPPFKGGFETSCPSCGEVVPYEMLLDVFTTPCPKCGIYPILYFWGKTEEPHMTEDLVYMFCEEGLMTEEHLENALETKRQSEPTPLIELLLSIQYVTVSELEDLAIRLLPDEWSNHLSGEAYREFERADTSGEAKKLARSEVDALYSLLDQIYSGCGYAFSRMNAEKLERTIRGLGGDLTTGDIRNHFGRLLLSRQILAGEITEPSFSRLFTDAFDLNSTEEAQVLPIKDVGEQGFRALAEGCVVPLERNEGIFNVGIAGHLLTLGFDAFFDLAQPDEIREMLQEPIEFSIMSLPRIKACINDELNQAFSVDPREVTDLLETAVGDLGNELTERYNALDEKQQPVAPGRESSAPAGTLRAIFRSSSISTDPYLSERSEERARELVRGWLYRPDALEEIPAVINQVTLDELETKTRNRDASAEDEVIHEVPEREEQEFRRLLQAFRQLREEGEVHPDKLHLPVAILDVVSEIEAGSYETIPIARAGDILWFGIAKPELQIMNELSALTGESVRLVKANSESIQEVLVRCYGIRRGKWTPEHRKENLHDREDYEDFLQLHNLPETRSELQSEFPEHLARELQVVPIQLTPEDLILAVTERPDFLDRQMLQVFFRRSVSYRFVSEKSLQKLLDEIYNGTDPDGGRNIDSSGSVERWSRENLERMVGTPLALEEIEMTEKLLDELTEKKKNAPEVQIITDYESACSLSSVYEAQGQLKIDPAMMETFPADIWTPAMETFFPVLPVKASDSELLFASSSMDRRWFLELLGLFINRSVNVIILPKSTIDDLVRQNKGGPEADVFDEEQPDDRSEQPPYSTTNYLKYRSTHLFESFHELAEENQLKKFIVLLLMYLFEHEQDALRVTTEEERCSIQSWRPESGPEQLFNIDNSHIYGLRYAFHEMAGEPLSDFRSSQHAIFHFIYRGEKFRTEFEARAIDEGQELILETNKA